MALKMPRLFAPRIVPNLVHTMKSMTLQNCNRMLPNISCVQVQTRMLFHGLESPNTEKGVKSFVYALDPNQRSLLYNELHKLEMERSKINESKVETIAPTVGQLRHVFIFSGVPFIGFGLLDNIIMILAGEYIDTTFGALLGISTMAAAALGNLVSDVFGVGLAGWVEELCSKVGIKPPDLTPQQLDTPSTRWSAGAGRSVGITIGCILGMFPLLFMDGRESEEQTDSKETDAKTEKSNEDKKS
ncbi:unnamed protein product [Owenia fusiformis]|uniref:Transmembrane protein 65 n=1 Tax=Owenia fusiformis TaxID=6347 RepID=A0A8S4MZC4_OWEFU|nr:unnamed protein product [Owenia fusiformis]